MARNCPLCHVPMQALSVRKVPLDWCVACHSIWFDRDELACAFDLDGVPEITRDRPAMRCPACPGMLWFSKLRESNFTACAACGGCFVSESALRKSTGNRLAEARFRCAVCGDGYPIADARPTAQGLACTRCTPTVPAPPKPGAEPSSVGPVDVAVGISDVGSLVEAISGILSLFG